MKTIEVFDPAMCCSTGICGPDVDPALVRFAADLDWLTGQGVTVQRYNLAQQPGEFAGRPVVATALQTKGDASLPLILVDGAAVSEGEIPPRARLAEWAGVEAPSEFSYTPQIDELVAIGAAIGSNCEPCLEFHVTKARELGITDEAMAAAVSSARKVKETPAREILRTADTLLGTVPAPRSATPLPVVQACCGGEAQSTTDSGDTPVTSSRCC
jgi:AhpD family alkylhydroperoxidase